MTEPHLKGEKYMRDKVIRQLCYTFVVFLFCWPLLGYEFTGKKWAKGSIVYFYVNPNTSDVTGEQGSVVNAASSWSSINPDGLKWTYMGTTTAGEGYDGQNTIYWKLC